MAIRNKENYKAWRKEWLKTEKGKAYKKRRVKKQNQWARKKDFIGVDGEGENYGARHCIKIKNGKKETLYYYQKHRYTLLAISTGDKIYNANGLQTNEVLKFFCDMQDKYSKGIFVIFAGGYDTNHILMSGLTKEKLQVLHNSDKLRLKIDGEDYELEYRPRKRLLIRRGRIFYKDKNDKWCVKWKTRFVLWDVWGFFQDSFIGVVDKWLGKDYKHYELIKEMKALRGNFNEQDKDKIERYNEAELEALVEVMNKVREALVKLEFDTGRWDGAGALAAAMMKKHSVKKYKYEGDLPSDVQNAVQCAYAGGRIEICKIGTYKGDVYDYDINSAYPTIMYNLPSLAGGFWQKGETQNPPSGFTLVYIKYDFVDGLPFYPLFFRTSARSILFPQRGEGWYWFPEYLEAINTPGIVEVKEWFHFIPATDEKPFSFIRDYYETRQQWVSKPSEEWQKGGEKVIKLGLNSLYGKTAQQLGGSFTKRPPYHQLEWAGYITSAIRARLYNAARQYPEATIGFATDGLFSTVSLSGLDLSDTKEFGKWELKKVNGKLPVGITVVMAGFYWWHNPDGSYQNFSRGFDKQYTNTPDFVNEAWKDKEVWTGAKTRRLIGIGTALTSDNFWKMRGSFVETERKLRIDGFSVKRAGLTLSKHKLQNNLIGTNPNPNLLYEEGIDLSSAPHPVIWFIDENEDLKNEDGNRDIDITNEIMDTINI